MHTPQLWPRSRTGRLRVSGFLALAVAATVFLVVSAGAGARNTRTPRPSSTEHRLIRATDSATGRRPCSWLSTSTASSSSQETLVKLNYQTNKLEPGLAVSWHPADSVVGDLEAPAERGSRTARRSMRTRSSTTSAGSSSRALPGSEGATVHVRKLRPVQEHHEGRRHDGEGHLHERAGECYLDALGRSRLHAEPGRRRKRGEELRQRGLSGRGRTS